MYYATRHAVPVMSHYIGDISPWRLLAATASNGRRLSVASWRGRYGSMASRHHLAICIIPSGARSAEVAVMLPRTLAYQSGAVRTSSAQALALASMNTICIEHPTRYTVGSSRAVAAIECPILIFDQRALSGQLLTYELARRHADALARRCSVACVA